MFHRGTATALWPDRPECAESLAAFPVRCLNYSFRISFSDTIGLRVPPRQSAPVISYARCGLEIKIPKGGLIAQGYSRQNKQTSDWYEEAPVEPRIWPFATIK